MIDKRDFGNHYTWINIKTRSREELRLLYKTYGIDSEVIDYSLDKNERAHLDYDQLNNTLIIIFNVSQTEKTDNHYETVPMTFIVKDHKLITVTNDKNHYIFYEMNKYLNKFPETSIYTFLFGSLFAITDFFFPYIEEMNEERVAVNHKLKQKTSKQNLLLLSDLNWGSFIF